MIGKNKKIFISTTTFAAYSKEPLDLLKANGFSCELNGLGRSLKEGEISEILKNNNYSGLIAGTEPLTRLVLENAVGLKSISRVGVGLDNVDLNAADKLKIKVYNTPDVLTDSVAELAIALILDCLRKISSMDRAIRGKTWKKESGLLFKGKTLGIIGFGRIGKRVAQLAKAFGAKIIFYDLIKPAVKAYQRVNRDKLFKDADIISIHVSSKEKIITAREISQMKDGVIIVNTSRGAVIDEEGLYNNLKTKKVAAAALDVFWSEPYSGRLTELDNVVLTPHIGSYAKEARVAMEIEAAKNLIRGFK